MDRRTFLKSSLLAAGAAALPRLGAAASHPAHDFRLHYAPHLGLFEAHAGKDPVDQIRFMAQQGFIEDPGMRERPVAEQQRIGDALREHGMRMGTFLAHDLDLPWTESRRTDGDPADRSAFLDAIDAAIAVAQRVNATWMTVVPGRRDSQLSMDYQTGYVVDLLRKAADRLEPHELVMILEPLNPHDYPDMFLTRMSQAYAMCRAVNSPACKILFDCYHHQMTEGHLILNIDTAWEEIAYLQIGDGLDCNAPTDRKINYPPLVQHLHEKNFDGIVGMEHSQPPPSRAAEQAVIDAYLTCDNA